MGSTRLLLNNLCTQFSKLSILNSTISCRNTLKNDLIVYSHPVFNKSWRYSHSFMSRCCRNTLKNDLIVYSHPHFNNSWRYSHSFMSRMDAAQLWKGVTSVSPAGKRKGRGKGKNRKIAKDLNRGQVIGFGKRNMLWPGLNAPVIQGREVLRQQPLPPDENREKRILELRDKGRRRSTNLNHPLDRGFSGTKLAGRSLGPPDPVGDDTFEGFDSRVLEFKTVMHMSGQRGRIRSLSAFVVVGNKKGLAGFALAKSTVGLSAAKAAKNKAAKVLRYVELDGTSVIHDFFTQFGAVRIFVEKRPPGFGLHCHRCIRCICEVIGIKDIYAKVEGATKNYQSVTKAFFIGLMRQKSLKEIANEKGLYVVKTRSECDNFPEVVAVPDKCRTEDELGPTELLDFKLHLHNGKVKEPREEYVPFYKRLNFPTYLKYLKDREKFKHQDEVLLHALVKYGGRESFLTVREKKRAKKELKDIVEETH